MDPRTRSVLETYDEGVTDPRHIAATLRLPQRDVRPILAEHRGDRPLAEGAALPVTAAHRDLRTASLLDAGDRSAKQRTRTLAARVRESLTQLQQVVAAEQHEAALRDRIAADTAELRRLRGRPTTDIPAGPGEGA